MNVRAGVVLALLVATGCRLFDPHHCPDPRPADVTCDRAQDLVGSGEVDRIFYTHCGTSLALRDAAGFITTPDRCDLRAKCDGGCPDVGSAIE
jgi:hypothetical protein